MTSLLPFPELQFFSNLGAPLAGGSIQTYLPNTLTPKTCWADPGQVTALANPIVLDAAGRAAIYGVGAYRFIVSDALSNVIYDQLSNATLDDDAISAAMLPVVGAATTATALSLLGVPAYVASIVSAIELMPGPTGPTGPIGATGAGGAVGPGGAGYVPTVTPGNPNYISFPGINGGSQNYFMQGGSAATASGSGLVTVNFPVAFPTGVNWIVATVIGGSGGARCNVAVSLNNNASFTVFSWSPDFSGNWAGGPVGFYWQANGY